MITRAAERSGELRARLEELGAEVDSLPLVRFLESNDKADLDRAIRSLDKFDWIIFTSVNAVTFFLARCRAVGGWPKSEGTMIAAVGSATRSAVEEQGLQASLVPAEFSGAGLAAELSGAISGKSVLLPRSDRASEELPSMLARAGAKVTEIVAYITTGAEEFDRGLIGSIRDGQVDAVTFFSPSAFQEFQKLMGPDLLAKHDSRVALAAIGPVTARAIRDSGLPLAIEADQATTASIVAGLERYFSTLESKNASRKTRAL